MRFRNDQKISGVIGAAGRNRSAMRGLRREHCSRCRTKPNVVCETATAKIDIRYADPKDLTQVILQIDKIVKRKDGWNSTLMQAPSGQVHEIIHVPNLTLKSSQDILARFRNTAKKMKICVSGEHTAFASDANHLAGTGMKLLFGMGASGEGAHSEKETLKLSTYAEKLSLDEAFVKDLITKTTE